MILPKPHLAECSLLAGVSYLSLRLGAALRFHFCEHRLPADRCPPEDVSQTPCLKGDSKHPFHGHGTPRYHLIHNDFRNRCAAEHSQVSHLMTSVYCHKPAITEHSNPMRVRASQPASSHLSSIGNFWIYATKSDPKVVKPRGEGLTLCHCRGAPLAPGSIWKKAKAYGLHFLSGEIRVGTLWDPRCNNRHRSLTKLGRRRQNISVFT